MSTSIILYGSRARGETRDDSDVDILAAEETGFPGSPKEVNGVSLHRYPQAWLINEAQNGSLFAYHVAFEGISLLDHNNFLLKLKKAICLKGSYEDEKLIAAKIIKLLTNRDWNLRDELKRRYFWALRTIIISSSAEIGNPIFSSKGLESFSEINGLRNHINNRYNENFNSCKYYGNLVLEKFIRNNINDDESYLRDELINAEGIGKNTIQLIETTEAIEVGGLVFYQ